MEKEEKSIAHSVNKEEHVPFLRKPLIRQMCLTALFLALMCVLSPLSIPVGPIPITLATLILYITGSLLDWKYAPLVIVLYLLLGVIGLPVFSSFQGGPQILLGPTGGYLVGYLPCIIIESLLISFFKDKKWLYPIAMIAGTIILYLLGSIWFMFYKEMDFGKTLLICVVPFLGGDAFKIGIASFCAFKLRPLIDRR